MLKQNPKPAWVKLLHVVEGLHYDMLCLLSLTQVRAELGHTVKQ
jgi:hypothetical protein